MSAVQDSDILGCNSASFGELSWTFHRQYDLI